MPEPIKRGKRYMPGLDGLRAVAVLGVIGYHLGIDWIPGGLLGVSVFFTLSGYLITDILLSQIAKTGRIRLKDFWFARARRLLPALFLMLIVVMAWVTVIGPHQDSGFRSAALTAAAYINNWWLIFRDVSYFAAFEAPAPLNHLWSLSIEEQFYIVWPFLLLIGTTVIREVRRDGPAVRPRLALATIGLALVSFVLMLVLYNPGIDPSRVYYGTDTRAMELLIGATLACVWPSRMLTGRIAPGARNLITGAGLAGLLVIALMYLRVDEFSPFLYRGGFLLLAIAVALTVAACAHPASPLGRWLGVRPLRWIGERSYGIYLWHFPVIILTTPEGADGPGFVRGALQVAATFGIAALSWKYVEDPIRHGALGRLWAQYKDGTLMRRWRPNTPVRRAVLAGCAVVTVAAFAGLLGLNIEAEPEQAVGEVSVATTETAEAPTEIDGTKVACDEVVHVGDSTSEGLVSSDYLPNEKQQIAAQYARVGTKQQHLEVSGARSIYETFEGLPNAETVAQSWKDQGFDGCWVFALGTNEAANVAAGSTVTYDDRIESMMDVADGDPVLWVNVKSLVESGPYAAANMEEWDKALEDACAAYPNMRIYDWASEVKDAWFIDDGIHFTTPGYAQRSRRIADALLNAFPEGSVPEAGDDAEAADASTETTSTTTTTTEDPEAAGAATADCLISS